MIKKEGKNNMKEKGDKWIEQAEKDYDAAVYNIKGDKIEQGVFFLQQSAEKALKAIYIKKFNKLFKTHDLALLSKKLNAPKKIIEYCEELSPAYQYTRYPDISQVKELEELEEDFLNYCGEIIKWVKKNI